MRWGRTALCSLAAVVAVILGTAPAASGGAPEAVARATTDTPPLTLVAQTNWVTPDQPWFNVTVGVSASEGSAAGLRVSMTYYSRLDSASQLQQAIDGTPGGSVLGRYSDVAVTSGTGSQGPGPGSTASACVTVLRDVRDTPPTSGTDVCAPGSLSIDMGCTPLSGTCGDVYPVAIALYRQNSTTPVARLTTFLTYQEAGAPGSIGRGGPLNVGLVLPDSTTADTKTLATALSDHPAVPTTLAMNPAGVQKSETADPKATSRALAQLGSLDSELVLAQPYEPIDLAAMSEAKIPSEISGADDKRRRDPPRRRPAAHRRSLGRHDILVRPGRQRRPRRGTAGGGINTAGHERRRPHQCRSQQLHLCAAFQPRPGSWIDDHRRRRRLFAQRALHGRPQRPCPQRRAIARRAVLRPLRERVPRPSSWCGDHAAVELACLHAVPRNAARRVEPERCAEARRP